MSREKSIFSADVARAARKITKSRKPVTVARVIDELGRGSATTVAPLLKAWKLQSHPKPDKMDPAIAKVFQQANSAIWEAAQAIARKNEEKLNQAIADLNSGIERLRSDNAKLEAKYKKLEIEKKIVENDRDNAYRSYEALASEPKTYLERFDKLTAKSAENLAKRDRRISEAEARLQRATRSLVETRAALQRERIKSAGLRDRIAVLGRAKGKPRH